MATNKQNNRKVLMKKHKKTSRIELNLGGNVQFKFNLYIIICTYVCLYLCQIYKCANE